MPNYNITIDSKFDPYSFEDYLKPAMLMQEQHNALAEAYAESLARSASLADALGSTGDANDAIALQAVNDYENNINNLSADLAQNGLNRANRRGIYDAKSKYGYIDSLKKAMDNRNTFIAKQNELALADPTRRFSDYASNYGITRFINPDFTYGSFSGAAIQKQVEDTVKYLAKSTYLRDPNNPEYNHIGGLTYMIREKTGAKPEEINAAMQAIMSGQPLNEKQGKIAQVLYDEAMGIAKQHLGNWEWNGLDKDAYEAAAKGLNAALGTEDFKTFNLAEPKDSSSGKTPKVAQQLSNRFHTLVFGDSEADRTGVTGAIDRWVANRYNKKVAEQYLRGNVSDLLNKPGAIETVFGLTNIGSGSSTSVDGITNTIDVAKAMGLDEDTINTLTKINDEIQKKTKTSTRIVNSGNQTATFYDTVSDYEPNAEAINAMKKVWNEYDRRVKMANAMTALSFEIPATKSDIERTFAKVLNVGGLSGHGLGADRYDNIILINGFNEDGTPRLAEKNNEDTRLTEKDANEAAKNNTIQFSAVPMPKKEGGKETTDLYYIMTVKGKHYLVPEGVVADNLKPNNLKSVDQYVKIQREYDAWSKNVDFNNLSDEQALQYALFNEAIGYGNSALGRSAAMALIGPEWSFNNQYINAPASSASNYNN